MIDFNDPEYKAAVAKLLQAIHDKKIATFEYLESIARDSEADLKHSGYKTHGEAFLKIMKRAQNEIEKLVTAHEKQFPD